VADRKASVEELKRASLAMRAQRYRRRLFSEFDRTKAVFLSWRCSHARGPYFDREQDVVDVYREMMSAGPQGARCRAAAKLGTVTADGHAPSRT
jgi:hypothetical protein